MRKMPKIERKLRRITWVVSVALALAIIFLDVFVFWGTLTFDELVFFAIIAAIFPLAILTYVDYRWRRGIDEHLPDLFRSIVQAQ